MKERYGTVYKGSQRLIDEESGEVIEVDKLYRKQTSGNFVKAYIVQLITLKILEEGNIIKRKTGVLMLNPELLMRGDDQKQKYLLLEFGNFEQEANEKQENALSDYYSFKD